MKKKTISLLLSLILVFSTTVIAHPLSGELLVNEDINNKVSSVVHVDGNYYTIDEFLYKLNAGHISLPDTNTRISYSFACCSSSDRELIEIMNSSWPWTECSNIAGHMWGTWSSWSQQGNIVHSITRCGHDGNFCSIRIRRIRNCRRDNCMLYQEEFSSASVNCFRNSWG